MEGYNLYFKSGSGREREQDNGLEGMSHKKENKEATEERLP